MTKVIYRLVGEHGQFRRSTYWTAWVRQCLCVQGVLVLTTEKCLPNYRRLVVLMLALKME